MLAENFMTATDLGISDIDRLALIKTMRAFERDEIGYADVDHVKSTRCLPDPNSLDARVPSFFSMEWVIGESDCGTTACILGWTRTLEPAAFPDDDVFPAALRFLFLYRVPLESGHGAWRAKPFQAAMAIRSYLTTGHAEWNAIIYPA